MVDTKKHSAGRRTFTSSCYKIDIKIVRIDFFCFISDKLELNECNRELNVRGLRPRDANGQQHRKNLAE